MFRPLDVSLLAESFRLTLRDDALASNAWPFVVARTILKRFEAAPPASGCALFETGYGPSGLPHIGTFAEVARTAMVRRAFEAISDIPTRLVCFSDDMDGMRSIPDNIPNSKVLSEHLQKPLADIPDPFGTHESFAAHNNARLREFLDRFRFDYEFIAASDFYRSGQFDEILLRAAERYDQIMEVMLETLRDERRQTYSCFLPISPKSGKVLYVPMKHVDGKEGTITFDDEEGTEHTLPVTGGNVKLQWKPDFGARWAATGVDFEMFGKDHSTNAPIYDRICEILGARKPVHYVYELFLDGDGQKISKSKGNGLTIEEWLTYAGPESLSFFMFQKPGTAKRLHWDTIPRAVDEYHRHLEAWVGQDDAARLANPAWHVHGGDAPESDLAVSFSMLLKLATAAGVEEKEVLWGFIQRYAPEARPESHPGLDAAAEHALRYYRDFVKPNLAYRVPTEQERAALMDLRDRLKDWTEDEGSADGKEDLGEELQGLVFATGTAHGFEPMRDWFAALYEVLLGAKQGPRFGSFILLYGIGETIALIDRAVKGELVEESGS